MQKMRLLTALNDGTLEAFPGYVDDPIAREGLCRKIREDAEANFAYRMNGAGINAGIIRGQARGGVVAGALEPDELLAEVWAWDSAIAAEAAEALRKLTAKACPWQEGKMEAFLTDAMLQDGKPGMAEISAAAGALSVITDKTPDASATRCVLDARVNYFRLWLDGDMLEDIVDHPQQYAAMDICFIC